MIGMVTADIRGVLLWSFSYVVILSYVMLLLMTDMVLMIWLWINMLLVQGVSYACDEGEALVVVDV